MIKLKKRSNPNAFIFLLLCSVSAITFYSCVDHNVGAQPHPVSCTDATTMHYSDTIPPEKSVQEIITANCLLSGCHGDAAGIPDWGNLSELQDHGDEIQRRITLPDSDPDKMPRVGSITDEERKIIYCWIEQGALDN